MSTSTFVTMRSDRTLLGIHAQIVQAIVADREWQGATPFEISVVLGLGALDEDAPHPILLIGRDKPIPIRASSSVTLQQLDIASVCAVPPLARNPDCRQTVSGVAFIDGKLPLIVLDPSALLAMADEEGAS